MGELEIRFDGARAMLNAHSGAISYILPGGTRFDTLAMDPDYRMENAHIDADCILFDLHARGLLLKGEISFQNGALEIRLAGEGAFDGCVRYPGDFDALPGDTALLPVGEGFAFPVDDPQVEIKNPERASYSGNMSMFFVGQTRGQAWLIAAAEHGHDAVAFTDRQDDGIIRSGLGWMPEMGQWGYSRAVVLLAGESGGITAAMKRYRAYRKTQGMVVSLRDKRRRVKNIDRLVGAANVWLWHRDGMNALYSPEDREWDVNNGEAIHRVASEMKQMGMDDVLWGLFFREDCEHVAYLRDEIGYLATHYEIYRDVIPKPEASMMTPTRLKRNHMMDSWPEDIAVDADGSLAKTWPIKGKDGRFHWENALCDMMALRRCMNRVPEDKKKYGWEARFIDTTASVGLHECHSADHPMTRRAAAYYRGALLRFLLDIGLVNGTEMISEIYVPALVYNEGAMSPISYRMEDAGRRMATVLWGNDVPESIDKFMLNPKYRAPLWELAFHDCVVSYWYWGDSAVSCPERIRWRDLFCRLYGLPEMYSFSVDNWETLKERIANSYHDTHDVAKRAGYEEMRSFAYLTKDCMVQQTEFETLKVTANFGEQPYTCQDGCVIPAGGSRLEAMEDA